MITIAQHEKVIGDTSGMVHATIAATKEAFEALSQRLYKYSERAIIREWFCNAIDAHADADTLHIPVDITLPTELDLNYTQRDYGIGLDPKGVEKYIADAPSQDLGAELQGLLHKEVKAVKVKSLGYTNRNGNCGLIRDVGDRLRKYFPQIYADLVGKHVDVELTERIDNWYAAMRDETRAIWNTKTNEKNFEIRSNCDEMEKKRPLLTIMLGSYSHTATTKENARNEINRYYKVKV